MTLHILYLVGHSAERGLSEPIIRRMKADPYFKVYVSDVLKPSEDDEFAKWELDLQDLVDSTHVVCSPCDRVEMVEPTFRWFLENKPIVRIYAGIQTSGGTYDDVVRRMLDSMGHILLTESEECRQNLIRQGEEEWRCPPSVGCSHLDDVQLLAPEEPYWQQPYAMFLMNPTTISKEQTKREMHTAMQMAISLSKKMFIVCFPPNGDIYSDIINVGLEDLETHYRNFHVYENRIPRNEFLFYLSRANVFISNSSATKYEYPALNPTGEVYNPSWRNQERTKPPPLQTGGSDRVISILKTIDWTDKEKLLRKRFRF